MRLANLRDDIDAFLNDQREMNTRLLRLGPALIEPAPPGEAALLYALACDSSSDACLCETQHDVETAARWNGAAFGRLFAGLPSNARWIGEKRPRFRPFDGGGIALLRGEHDAVRLVELEWDGTTLVCEDLAFSRVPIE